MLSDVAITDSFVLVVILVAFIIIGYKALSILKNALIIAVLATVFPFALNTLFNAHFSTGYAAELRYITIALGLYLVYEVLSLFVGIGGIFWEIFRMLAKPFAWAYDGIKALLGGNKQEKQKKRQKDE